MMVRRCLMVGFIMSLALILLAAEGRAQEPQIVVAANAAQFSNGSAQPLTLSLKVTNLSRTAVTADVYIGFVFPGGDIFCFDNINNINSISACGNMGNLRLKPLAPAINLPANLNYSTDSFFSTAPKPLASLGLPEGDYKAFGLLARPGTLDVLSLSFADFSVGGEPQEGILQARTVYATFKGNHIFRDNIKNRDVTEERELWVTNASTQENHPLAWNGNLFSASYTENISTRTSQTVSISGEMTAGGEGIKTITVKRQLSGNCLSGGGSNEETTGYTLIDIPKSSSSKTTQYRYELEGEAVQKYITDIVYKEQSDCLKIDNSYVSTDWATSQLVVVFYAD